MTLARSPGGSVATYGAARRSDSCIVRGHVRRDPKLGLIGILLRPRVCGGGRIIKAELAQHDVDLFEDSRGNLGCAERHPGASREIEHPGGNHCGRVTGDAADEDDLSSSPHLSVLNVNVGPVGGMPRVMQPRAK
jgi:hypothetical protein